MAMRFLNLLWEDKTQMCQSGKTMTDGIWHDQKDSIFLSFGHPPQLELRITEVQYRTWPYFVFPVKNTNYAQIQWTR